MFSSIFFSMFSDDKLKGKYQLFCSYIFLQSAIEMLNFDVINKITCRLSSLLWRGQNTRKYKYLFLYQIESYSPLFSLFLDGLGTRQIFLFKSLIPSLAENKMSPFNLNQSIPMSRIVSTFRLNNLLIIVNNKLIRLYQCWYVY